MTLRTSVAIPSSRTPVSEQCHTFFFNVPRPTGNFVRKEYRSLDTKTANLAELKNARANVLEEGFAKTAKSLPYSIILS